MSDGAHFEKVRRKIFALSKVRRQAKQFSKNPFSDDLPSGSSAIEDLFSDVSSWPEPRPPRRLASSTYTAGAFVSSSSVVTPSSSVDDDLLPSAGLTKLLGARDAPGPQFLYYEGVVGLKPVKREKSADAILAPAGVAAHAPATEGQHSKASRGGAGGPLVDAQSKTEASGVSNTVVSAVNESLVDALSKTGKNAVANAVGILAPFGVAAHAATERQHSKASRGGAPLAQSKTEKNAAAKTKTSSVKEGVGVDSSAPAGAKSGSAEEEIRGILNMAGRASDTTGPSAGGPPPAEPQTGDERVPLLAAFDPERHKRFSLGISRSPHRRPLGWSKIRTSELDPAYLIPKNKPPDLLPKAIISHSRGSTISNLEEEEDEDHYEARNSVLGAAPPSSLRSDEGPAPGASNMRQEDFVVTSLTDPLGKQLRDLLELEEKRWSETRLDLEREEAKKAAAERRRKKPFEAVEEVRKKLFGCLFNHSTRSCFWSSG